jgi:hypothetical protein
MPIASPVILIKKNLILHQVAPCGSEIIFEHKVTFGMCYYANYAEIKVIENLTHNCLNGYAKAKTLM